VRKLEGRKKVMMSKVEMWHQWLWKSLSWWQGLREQHQRGQKQRFF